MNQFNRLWTLLIGGEFLRKETRTRRQFDTIRRGLILSAKQPIFAKTLKTADCLNISILHGTKLESTKPTRRDRKAPVSWPYNARLNAEMSAAVDRIAATSNVSVSDVIRSAIAMFLKHTETESGSPLPHIDPSSAPAIAQPRLADAYKGSGGSDQHALRQARDRQSQVLAREARGERLVDKTPTR